MARWHKWDFVVQAPSDEFVRLLQRALVVRSVHVDTAKAFDFQARGFGSRIYVSVAWTDTGVALTAKVKSGLFGSPLALERVFLEAAREAEARLAAGEKAV